jgi:hypothetical protein
MNAKQHGYAVARNKLYNDKKGELRRRTFRCAMGRKYEDLATRRTTSSRMTGCDFACDAIRVIDENGERWKVRVSNPAHNHGPDLHPSAEPAHRKRDEAAKKLILVLQAAHLTPRDILNIFIKHDQEANYTRAEYQE